MIKQEMKYYILHSTDLQLPFEKGGITVENVYYWNYL